MCVTSSGCVLVADVGFCAYRIQTFVHALLHLAADSSGEYIETIREEVERVIKEDGWTKVAMTKMWKLDSFLKESQRMNGIGLSELLFLPAPPPP